MGSLASISQQITERSSDALTQHREYADVLQNWTDVTLSLWPHSCPTYWQHSDPVKSNKNIVFLPPYANIPSRLMSEIALLYQLGEASIGRSFMALFAKTLSKIRISCLKNTDRSFTLLAFGLAQYWSRDVFSWACEDQHNLGKTSSCETSCAEYTGHLMLARAAAPHPPFFKSEKNFLG